MVRTLLTLVLVGCFKPTPKEGFACGPEDWCPQPLECQADGRCWSTGIAGDGSLDGDGAGGRANLAFVTSQTFLATELGPPPASDQRCTEFANANGHPGTFVAWASTLADPVRARLGSARGWVRVDGRPFADTLDALGMGVIYYPLRKDETGADRVVPVLTGTGGTGTGADEDCLRFTSNQLTDIMLLGISDGGSGHWTADDEGACDVRYAVYCLQTNYTVQVAPSAASGRRAFLSETPFTPGSGGIGAADTLCQTDADQAGLTGTFRALLATTTTSALSRFTVPSSPFVRLDGVETTANFASWDAPIEVTSTGAYRYAYVFAGAASVTSVATSGAQNCNNWTASTGSSLVGLSARTGADAFGTLPGTCNPQPIYCLEL